MGFKGKRLADRYEENFPKTRFDPKFNEVRDKTGNATVVAVCLGSAAFVAMMVFSLCFIIRRRSRERMANKKRSPLKQFLLPKEVKPVIGFRTAAGPGGLKKSPSPLQSPDSSSTDWSTTHRCASALAGDAKGSGMTISKSVSCSSDGGLARKASLLSAAAGGMVPSLSAMHLSIASSSGSSSSAKAAAGELRPLMAPEDHIHVADVKHKENYDPTRKGTINFTLSYNFDKNALLVHVHGATNLPPKNCLSGNDTFSLSLTPNFDFPPGHHIVPKVPFDPESTSSVLDPYIKLQLLPEKQHKVKTRVVRNTLNPVYDEEFTFYGLGYNQLQSTTLHFVVVTFDRFSRDEIVGELVCPLHTINLSQSEKRVDVSMELLNRTSKFQNVTNRGDVLISLCYQPATSKVTVVVLKAKNLPKFDITGFADPYVKVYMMYNGQKVAKKKTHVKKRTLAPVFNESFTFDAPCVTACSTMAPKSSNAENVATGDCGLSFELLVMDWDRVTKNEVMGRIDVGPRASTASGRQHWIEACRQPNKQVAEWHRLRP